MCEVYNLLLKELLEFQAKIAYFTDEETQAKRYKVLNIMKWNIFRNLHDFHRSTSKRYYFGGSISQQCVSVLTVVFILLYTESCGPREAPQKSQGRR